MDDLAHTFSTTQGLRSLFDSFPRECSACGHVYDSLDALLVETANFPGARCLRQGGGVGEMPFVELVRQCRCGATLIEPCQDRRRTSRDGAALRTCFSEALDEMASQGLIKVETIRFLRGMIRNAEAPESD